MIYRFRIDTTGHFTINTYDALRIPIQGELFVHSLCPTASIDFVGSRMLCQYGGMSGGTSFDLNAEGTLTYRPVDDVSNSSVMIIYGASILISSDM